MKKLIFSGFLTSVLVMTSVAFAEEPATNQTTDTSSTTLTTKKYVDDGLIYVYDKVKAAKTVADNASAAINNAQTGLLKRVGDIEEDVNNATTGLKARVSELENKTYDSFDQGVGITITTNQSTGKKEINVEGLADTTGNNADKIYVYQDGALTELPVTSSWSPTVLGESE